MPVIELDLKQVVKVVKQLTPAEKLKLWEEIGNGLARVSANIREQSQKLGLSKLSDSEINQLIHQVRKQRG